MVKLIVLLITILLALGSVAGYLFIDGKINVGEMQIAEGQKQLDEGKPTLDEGKAKLEAGKRELSEGKKKYEQAHDNSFLVFLDNLFNAGKGFEEGRKQIAEGDKQVARGEDKVNVGERRLEAGKLELQRGMDRLKLARDVRMSCALGAAFFAALSIALGYFWRRSLARIFLHT